MNQYLLSTAFIDWKHPEVHEKAMVLSRGLGSEVAIAETCFLFVRDEIKHSYDFQLNTVTAKASDVLKHKTGYCYAKSHLLAALLRANSISAGLCYQRLTIANNQPPFCLHGLNAVFLEKYGWYRMDARGNNEAVDARFCPPDEQLAFPIITDGECDMQGVWPEPLPMVIEVLENNHTYLKVFENLPDIEIL